MSLFGFYLPRVFYYQPAILLFVVLGPLQAANAQSQSDLQRDSWDDQNVDRIPDDLVVPPMDEGQPRPGKRVKAQLDSYVQTKVFHTIYLPTDWEPNKNYPVICEFAGNGPYKNKFGDVCSGKIEDSCLGYGISGGKRFIWVGLPFVSQSKTENQLKWWGDVDASVDYAKQAVECVCRQYGGDPKRVLLCGFSRGSIACNFIGLHDDEIADLWCGMICHSHYDGVRRWRYQGQDRDSAMIRLKRLGDTPQFICNERNVAAAKKYVEETGVEGNFTFVTLPFQNHTDRWVLKDYPQRRRLRAWVDQIVKAPQ